MSMLKWSDSLSVSIAEIDEQHKGLVAMVNRVYDLLVSGASDRPQAIEVIEDMRRYSVDHFGTEEKFMDKFDYPEAPAHKLKHQEFIDKVKEIENGCADGTCILTMDILNYLSDWLVTHINDTDKKLGAFLEDKIE
ncbi:bacteriohemerythrin [Maridesulfovibrio salexigens]|uniref:Hemerythrin-like metal-binding protein n=1 Tax=Maridesulfovibrio salexigens (strain ATCC 14822 / DSM 2638 / NCIMB 8403 / VKM B-1763) TaxID=526222 RepID=C6BXD9_MARSD|nr:bacteriohemerythrin [Maridesulfovibrio salexigens]ACS80445.1 hemerythrin-like metal-binding protein [Maridesulfovibrio salexigens DSM 2638]